MDEGLFVRGFGDMSDGVRFVNPWDRRDKLGEIRSIARELRADAPCPSETPDFSAAILGRVDAERPFLNRKTRKFLWLGRGLIAASIFMGCLAVFLTYRYSPDMLDFSGRASPLSAVVDRAATQATSRVVVFQESLQSAPQSLARMIEPLDTSKITFEGTQAFTGPMIPPLEAACREMPSQCVAGSMSMSDWSERLAGTVTSGVQSIQSARGGTLVLNGRRMPVGAETSNLARYRAESLSDLGIGHSPALTPMSDTDSGIAPR